VLKNLTRDWSAEGAPERSQSYGRLAAEVRARLGAPPADGPPPRVLVPGAGLGRLCCDLAALGYEAQVLTTEMLHALYCFFFLVIRYIHV